MGGLAKGGAVVPRVDGYSPPRARELVLQVSKHGAVGSKERVDLALYNV